jgi:hypothetical protein
MALFLSWFCLSVCCLYLCCLYACKPIKNCGFKYDTTESCGYCSCVTLGVSCSSFGDRMVIPVFVPSVIPHRLCDNAVNLTDAMSDVVQRS